MGGRSKTINFHSLTLWKDWSYSARMLTCLQEHVILHFSTERQHEKKQDWVQKPVRCFQLFLHDFLQAFISFA